MIWNINSFISVVAQTFTLKWFLLCVRDIGHIEHCCSVERSSSSSFPHQLDVSIKNQTVCVLASKSCFCFSYYWLLCYCVVSEVVDLCVCLCLCCLFFCVYSYCLAMYDIVGVLLISVFMVFINICCVHFFWQFYLLPLWLLVCMSACSVVWCGSPYPLVQQPF
jgi:hypothetical protein